MHLLSFSSYDMGVICDASGFRGSHRWGLRWIWKPRYLLFHFVSVVTYIADDSLQLVDVREEWEWETASIPGFKLFPLSKFEDWSEDIGDVNGGGLDPQKKTLCLCHHGIRSQQMAQFLVSQAGFTDVSNIVGGIDAWSRNVDSRVPTY